MLMKKLTLILIICGSSLPATVDATATTHIWGPSTDVQAFNLWHITSDMYLPLTADTSGNLVATVTNIGVTVGVLPFRKVNMEIGMDHKSGLGVADRYPLYCNAKRGIPENAFGK